VARVDDGNVFVGAPGAPGWTTTGPEGSACCADVDSDNKQTTAHAAEISISHERGLGQGPS